MKHPKFNFLFILGLLLAFAAPARAATRYHTYTQNGTAVSNGTFNIAHTIISAKGDGANQGAPAIEYLNVTSDSNTAAVVFYRVTNTLSIAAASSGTTNILRLSSATLTNLFLVTNTICVLRHTTNDTYERVVILNPTAGASGITLTTATGSAVTTDDKLYQLTINATIPVNVATKELTTRCYVGTQGDPLYIEIGGNTNRAINNATFRYTTPLRP